MKIWLATWYDNSGMGTCREWFSTKRAAEAAMRTAIKNGDGWVNDHGISQEDVPTKKGDLIRWLNANCNSDNG